MSSIVLLGQELTAANISFSQNTDVVDVSVTDWSLNFGNGSYLGLVDRRGHRSAADRRHHHERHHRELTSIDVGCSGR